jgi:glycosyltransferase involved in cell wall biosynthesis
MPPKFSIIIPTYNQGMFIAEAVQSVLNQTIQDFDILIVDDASTDNTTTVLEQFHDPRLNYIRHDRNRGGAATRNTGILAATGEWLVLLDADDFFHPQKLEAHLRFIDAHRDVKITYNSRYQLHHSSLKVRDIHRPPANVTLKDFVLGYPFSPSDTLIHRDVIARVGLYEEEYRNWGEEFEYNARIALEGFTFARVDGVLNYRRYHTGRRNTHLEDTIRLNLQTLDKIFADPRCPDDTHEVRKTAYINYYIEVLCVAYAQGDYELGKKYIRDILQLDPTIILETPNRLINALFMYLISDDNVDHEKILHEVFNNLPAELPVSPQAAADYAAQGYLLKGTRSALWVDEDAATAYFQQAHKLHARVDQQYREMLVAQLDIYRSELGSHAAEEQALRLFPYLEGLWGKECVRQIKGLLAANRAFHCFRMDDYRHTLREVVQAVKNDIGYLSNRGMLSIAARSMWNSAKHGFKI